MPTLQSRNLGRRPSQDPNLGGVSAEYSLSQPLHKRSMAWRLCAETGQPNGCIRLPAPLLTSRRNASKLLKRRCLGLLIVKWVSCVTRLLRRGHELLHVTLLVVASSHPAPASLSSTCPLATRFVNRTRSPHSHWALTAVSLGAPGTLYLPGV